MLKILGFVLVVSIAVGFATKGRLAGLGRLTFRGLPLLYLALGLGLFPLLISVGHSVGRALVTSGYVILAIFLLLNLRQPRRAIGIGIAVLCLGWLLNATPFIANGGMPLSLSAYYKAGFRETPTPSQGGFFKIVIAHAGTHLRFLGDVIPVRFIGQVLSFGDIVLALGVAWIIIASMHSTESANASR